LAENKRTPATPAGPGKSPESGQTRHQHSAQELADPTSLGGIGQDTGALHRLLVESVQDYAIFALDAHGVILSWNAGARRIKGYSADEIIGKHFSIFYPRELVEEGFPEFELRTAANTGRFEDEGWRIRKDGSRFWANVVITALRSKEGKLLGYAKVTRDLTERREAEEALRESEERFRLLVEGVKEYAIFMLDPTGRVATWNEGAERIKGYRAKEIIGKHFSEFYLEEDKVARRPERELDIARRTGKYDEEGRRVRRDGTTFWASITITAIRNKSGELIGFAKVTRDLTERRAAEKHSLENARRLAGEEAARRAAETREHELRELTDQLRQQTDELEARTREAEEARQHASDSLARADEANRAKSQFLAAMSHELRTPLNAIGGYTDLLTMGLSGPITDQQQEQLSRIRRSQEHLLGIINDILNFSRLEAGQLTYKIVPVAISEVVEAVAQMIMPQAKSKGLKLDDEACRNDAVALADRSKVEQIVLNLVSNAVKFTGSGGKVTLACEARRNRIVLTVLDTGSGIPKDKLEAIFEPFVQVGRTLTSSREGAGLGLAISRDLARGMGGDITVDSRVGVGSEFKLTLPAEHQQKPARA
jgi:PAS domain S-box-containing protein